MTQSGVLGMANSDTLGVEFGVPQGSILGPFLFIVYMNDLVRDNIMYADDTTCLVTEHNFEKLEISACIKVAQLTQELAARNLKVNTSKTGVMVFNRKKKNRDSEPVLQISEEIITNQDCLRFLGIHVDRDLRWTEHVDVLCKRLCSGLYVLRNLAKIASREVTLSVYFALVQSHIIYGIALWGSCSVTNMDRVFKLQKRAMRYIYALRSDESCKTIFQTQRVLTVPSLYILEVCVHLKKNINYVKKSGDSHAYGTRGRNLLDIPLHRTNRYEQKPSYRGVRLYNRLPEKLKSIVSTRSFKSALKCYLLERCYYSVSEFIDV